MKAFDTGIYPDVGYLVYRKCTPSWKIKDRLGIFNYWDLTYVTAGKARYTIDGKVYDLSAGDLLCMPPFNTREARTWPDNLMNCFAVNFSLKTSNPNPEIEAAPLLPLPLVSHVGLKEDLIHLFHEMVFAWIDRQPLYAYKVRAYFMLVLHRLFELILYNIDSTITDIRIRKITRYISSHYAEKISVRKMADMVGLNPVYLGALFKQETGMTLNHYLVKTRVRNAKNLLRSGEYKVSTVAELCGYCDVYHFYKQFKQICGISPSGYIPKKDISSQNSLIHT